MANYNDSQLRKSMQINETLVNYLLMGIGIIFILIGAFAPIPEKLVIVLSGVGCSLLASAIVAWFNARYTIKKQAEAVVLDEWGLCAIYPTRQDMNKSCDIALHDASKEIEMIGFGFRSLRDSQDSLIKEKVSRGVKIRIISMNPDSEFLMQREKDEKVSKGSIRESIIQLGEWVDELNKYSGRKNKVQIKYYDSLPQDFYFRADGHVFVGPYQYGKQSQQTISYEYVRKAEGYKHYTNYFNTLWNDENFCKSR